MKNTKLLMVEVILYLLIKYKPINILYYMMMEVFIMLIVNLLL